MSAKGRCVISKDDDCLKACVAVLFRDLPMDQLRVIMGILSMKECALFVMTCRQAYTDCNGPRAWGVRGCLKRRVQADTNPGANGNGESRDLTRGQTVLYEPYCMFMSGIMGCATRLKGSARAVVALKKFWDDSGKGVIVLVDEEVIAMAKQIRFPDTVYVRLLGCACGDASFMNGVVHLRLGGRSFDGKCVLPVGLQTLHVEYTGEGGISLAGASQSVGLTAIRIDHIEHACHAENIHHWYSQSYGLMRATVPFQEILSSNVTIRALCMPVDYVAMRELGMALDSGSGITKLALRCNDPSQSSDGFVELPALLGRLGVLHEFHLDYTGYVGHEGDQDEFNEFDTWAVLSKITSLRTICVVSHQVPSIPWFRMSAAWPLLHTLSLVCPLIPISSRERNSHEFTYSHWTYALDIIARLPALKTLCYPCVVHPLIVLELLPNIVSLDLVGLSESLDTTDHPVVHNELQSLTLTGNTSLVANETRENLTGGPGMRIIERDTLPSGGRRQWVTMSDFASDEYDWTFEGYSEGIH